MVQAVCTSTPGMYSAYRISLAAVAVQASAAPPSFLVKLYLDIYLNDLN